MDSPGHPYCTGTFGKGAGGPANPLQSPGKSPTVPTRDRVMVLVPNAESKLLAQWQGPYEVVEPMGEVTYKVQQPGHWKQEQIYHINLLKPWHQREVCVVAQETPIQRNNMHEQIRISTDLTPNQKKEVTEMNNRYQDVFSTKPGRTTEAYHHIFTDPGAMVTLRPYQVPAAKREEIKAEVKRMLELGVIEESHHQWSSPIVLVPKPDGTTRFCNDFRRLNEISKFDAYPIPSIDELVDRLGNARFLTTLDLTKGYWQIHLAKDAKEKTAFSTPEGLFQYTVLPFGLHLLCRKNSKYGRRQAWLNSEILADLKYKKEAYKKWKIGRMTGDEYKNIARACRSEIRKAK
ncbi:unnamed protein product [Eretmochelys imbricata]